jgi:hypothetical protein
VWKEDYRDASGYSSVSFVSFSSSSSSSSSSHFSSPPLPLPSLSHSLSHSRSRICLFSSPCLAGYYGTSSHCRRCPPRSSSETGKSFSQVGFYLVADLTKPYGYVGVCYCDAYTDTHPYIYASHVHAPNQFHTYTDTHSYILHTVLHAGARDFVRNVQCISNPFRSAPIYQTANARQAFTCIQCQEGYYKAAAQLNVSCIHYPDSSDSAEGSTSIQHCICLPGLDVTTNSYNRRVTSPSDICEPEISSWIRRFVSDEGGS